MISNLFDGFVDEYERITDDVERSARFVTQGCEVTTQTLSSVPSAVTISFVDRLNSLNECLNELVALIINEEEVKVRGLLNNLQEQYLELSELPRRANQAQGNARSVLKAGRAFEPAFFERRMKI